MRGKKTKTLIFVFYDYKFKITGLSTKWRTLSEFHNHAWQVLFTPHTCFVYSLQATHTCHFSQHPCWRVIIRPSELHSRMVGISILSTPEPHSQVNTWPELIPHWGCSKFQQKHCLEFFCVLFYLHELLFKLGILCQHLPPWCLSRGSLQTLLPTQCLSRGS